MKMKLFIILTLATYLNTSHARCPKRPNQRAIMSALQNVFSQGNTDRAMQMMLMAKRRNFAEEMAKYTQKLPANQLAKCPSQNPPSVFNEPKCRKEPINHPVPSNLQNLSVRQEVSPNVPTGNNITPNSPQNCPRPSLPFRPEVPVAIKPEPSIPCREVHKAPVKRQEIIHIPVPYPVPVKEPCSQSRFPFSPFLPAASPVSALAPPTSNLLPPMIPSQTRNHFLRRIPIPPPTL